jgi:hypothetical protein
MTETSNEPAETVEPDLPLGTDLKNLPAFLVRRVRPVAEEWCGWCGTVHVLALGCC